MTAPASTMPAYAAETFTDDERVVLRRYFTNLDGPVFALVNLPEVVKGALFARYSRSAKSLRRQFLHEFVGELDTARDESIDATVGLERAEALYDRVFFEYGDDSVAQLGGVHLACEQSSNLLTKILEWGRLMSYLEQSTRYIPYDERLGGRFRYFRDPEILASNLGARYVSDMDKLFEIYSELAERMGEHFRSRHPKSETDSDFVYRQAVRAKAFDAVRGILPAAALSNVGIYGSGQSYESLLVRMRSHPLPEARTYADMMLVELRKVIPSFLKRVDLPDRGVAVSDYLATNRDAMEAIAYEILDDGASDPEPSGVELVDFDPEGEVKVVAAMLYAAAGAALAGILRNPGVNIGSPYLLGPIAAVVIGGASLTGGLASPLATFTAALFLTGLNQMMRALGLPTALQFVVFGAVIIGGMLISGDRIIKGIERVLREKRSPHRDPAVRFDGT